MRKIAFCFIILSISLSSLSAQNVEEIKTYIDFLKKKNLSAKEYILSLFKENDIVILCERDHREFTQYHLFLEIINDPYFKEQVGVIFTEIGARNLEPDINKFFQNKELSKKEIDKYILNYQRDCMFYPIWKKSSFSYFVRNLYDINQKATSNKPILMFPSDLPKRIAEPSVDKVKDLYKMDSFRDSLMATYIINKFDSLRDNNVRHKALVIMNYRHAFGHSFYIAKGTKADNVGRFLFEAYPGRTANVMVNSYAILDARSDTDITFGVIQDGKWDAAFRQLKINDMGFSFGNSPFGDDSFDYWPLKNEFEYKDVFDGFVFYTPIEKFEMTEGIPNFLEDGFFEKLAEREALFYEAMKKPVIPTDKEKAIYYNNIHINKMDNLEKLQTSIEKWLK